MERRRFLTLTGAMAVGGLAGCLDTTSNESSNEPGPQSAVREYVAAVNKSDPQAVKASMHPDSPRRNMSPTLMLVDQMEITLHELETVSKNETHATVQANVTVTGMGREEQTKRKLPLRIEQGEWKLW